MGDWLMLVCAVLAALTAGVLAGYGVCFGMFAMFRTKRLASVETTIRVSGSVNGSTSAVEG